jgi:hypothetical protein
MNTFILIRTKKWEATLSKNTETNKFAQKLFHFAPQDSLVLIFPTSSFQHPEGNCPKKPGSSVPYADRHDRAWEKSIEVQDSNIKTNFWVERGSDGDEKGLDNISLSQKLVVIPDPERLFPFTRQLVKPNP